MNLQRASATVLSLTIAAQLLAQVNQAAAQGAQESAVNSETIIMIASRQDEDASLRVIGAIEGQISDLPVALRIEWVEQQNRDMPTALDAAKLLSERTEALAVFWCDLSRAEEVYLYLSDRGQRRVLVRRLDIGDEGVRFESLAVIVHSVVAAMLKGAEIGMEVEPEPRAEPEEGQTQNSTEPARAEESEAKAARFAAEVGYDISGRSPQAPVIHGLLTGFSITLFNGLHVFAEYIFRFPIEVDEQNVSLTIKTHPILTGMGYAWRVKRLSLGVGGAFMADFISQTTRQAATDDALSVDNDDFIASLLLLLTTDVTIVESMALRFVFAAQWNLNGVRYVAMDSVGEEIVVDEPWQLVPRGMVAAVFSF